MGKERPSNFSKIWNILASWSVVDPGFGKGGFIRMCTVATTPPFDAICGCCFNGL